jgi:hypothetical protein
MKYSFPPLTLEQSINSKHHSCIGPDDFEGILASQSRPQISVISLTLDTYIKKNDSTFTFRATKYLSHSYMHDDVVISARAGGNTGT